MSAKHGSTPITAYAFPIAAVVLVGIFTMFGSDVETGLIGTIGSVVAGFVMLGAVFAALHHADKIADHLGEPFGTLLLTLAVTLIEVTIVASLMLHGENNPTLAREAVFSVVMIVTTGLVGVCLLVGALRFREQEFQVKGVSAFLTVLIALTMLTLVLPDFTRTALPGRFSVVQLVFVSVTSIVLYSGFLFVQTVRHREDFIDDNVVQHHAHRSLTRVQLGWSLIWLLAGLLGVVLLAEHVAAGIEDGIGNLGLARPDPLIGAVVALMVLMPETVNALKAAAGNDLQRSLNIALGSALATAGLTFPAVSVVSLVTGREVTFGLDPPDVVLMVTALLLSVVSFGTGRTNMLTGLVHVVVFAVFVLLLIEP